MASEAVVSFVTEKLGDLLVEEARVLYEVRDQFEWIVDELRRMRCFLKDADAKQKEDERVRNWVTQIRHVSYDAEDVIDTFILTQTAQGNRRGLFAFVKRFICLVNRYRVGKQIQNIKMKISDISSSLHTYGIRDINDGGQETRLNIHRLSSALYEEPDTIGMQESVITLKKQLLNKEARRCVISIVGMGGSGKTTLAKKVYRDVKHNFVRHAFIYLSRQYRIRDVLISIITECGMSLSSEEKEKSNEEELRKKLYGCLTENRYLVVIDDIWSMEAWDELKFILPDVSNKSRVLLTTRIQDVALHADGSSQPHPIRLLSEDESWELFYKKVFLQGDACPPDLKEIGKKILKKCGGLPLAIVVLGGLLSRREKTLSAWSRVFDSVNWHLAEDSKQCMEILALSYYDLPHYLKPCFLYLSLFPEDYEIQSKELIRLWVAEGFIQQRGNEIMEDVAEDYLEELIGRSMIQVARKRRNGSVSRCRIHDLLRDLSISESKQVNFFGIDGDNDTNSSLASLRRVALQRNVDEYETIIRSTKSLRSMLCFSSSTIHLSKLLNRGSKLLRVLSVDSEGFLSVDELPEEIGEEVHLRYLRVTTIIFPSSIGNLSNLQVIILSDCNGTLPSAIWGLERLRHLYAYYWKIDGDPRLKNFRNLQTLCLRAGSWIGDGLDKLTNLRKLGINGAGSSHYKALSDATEKLCNLRSFKWNDWVSILPFVSFAHHRNLYKLYLHGLIETIPKMPPNLAKLTLCNSQLQQDAIKTLEKLQNLRVLRLRAGSYCSAKMICSSGGFPRLEFLELHCSDLEEWIVEEGAMKSLKRVELEDHDHLKPLPKQVVDLLSESGSRKKTARAQMDSAEDQEINTTCDSQSFDGQRTMVEWDPLPRIFYSEEVSGNM